MPLTLWPPDPATYPEWPPSPEVNGTISVCANIRALASEFVNNLGFSLDQPTPQERNTFFRDALCNQGHNVNGRMLVSPDGTRRYPFAVCVNATHQELLVLWSPWSAGPQSGLAE